jgi:hypothetical protein
MRPVKMSYDHPCAVWSKNHIRGGSKQPGRTAVTGPEWNEGWRIRRIRSLFRPVLGVLRPTGHYRLVNNSELANLGRASPTSPLGALWARAKEDSLRRKPGEFSPLHDPQPLKVAKEPRCPSFRAVKPLSRRIRVYLLQSKPNIPFPKFAE